jgi:hypothetical protein
LMTSISASVFETQRDGPRSRARSASVNATRRSLCGRGLAFLRGREPRHGSHYGVTSNQIHNNQKG